MSKPAAKAAEAADSVKSEAEQAAIQAAQDEAAQQQPVEQPHAPMPASQFVLIFGIAELSVPMAGLLEHQPELRDQDLIPDEWQAALDAYLASPRP